VSDLAGGSVVPAGGSVVRNGTINGGDPDVTAGSNGTNGKKNRKPPRDLLPGEFRGAHGGGVLRPFPKGVSGCPGGVNQTAYARTRSLCAQVSVEAVEKQIHLMRTCEDDRVVFMVTQAIIERGAGKVRDHTGDDKALSRLDVSSLAPSDRVKLAELLSRALGLDKTIDGKAE
jgi:hypothetical protein